MVRAVLGQSRSIVSPLGTMRFPDNRPTLECDMPAMRAGSPVKQYLPMPGPLPVGAVVDEMVAAVRTGHLAHDRSPI
jgi:hypothetical protein